MDRKVKQLLSRGWGQWEEGGSGEGEGGKYGGCIVYPCMQTEQ
jgi:hypothetical protein